MLSQKWPVHALVAGTVTSIFLLVLLRVLATGAGSGVGVGVATKNRTTNDPVIF